MTIKPWLVITIFALFLTACGDFVEEDLALEDEGNGVSPADDSPDILVNEPSGFVDSGECPFDLPAGFDITCGHLTVPENRTRPDVTSIQLAYAIVYAAEDEGRPPILYLAGGPGGSAIDDFLSDPEGWDYPFTRTRDLVLLDQRGTGYSQPSLDCPELAEEFAFEDQDPEVACHDRLVAEGIDLTAYNTAENAADVEALRQELGVESWDLLGISYGTRLALSIMGDYPQGVRSAVLDSVFPPNADTPTDEALAPYRSLQRLFADCVADDYCADVYPDLEGVFLETVAALNESPEDDLFGDDFAFIVTNALNDSELIPLIPYVIDAVANGDIGALDEIEPTGSGSSGRRYQEEPDRSDSEGMYNSVICHDEYVFGDYDAVESRLVGTVPEAIEAALLQPVNDLFRVCSYWGAGVAGSQENEAVRSDIPTLILAGGYDHATPPEWAALAAETLSNAFVYEFPGAGHSLLSGQDCAIAITAGFLDAPEQEPDSDCIAGIEWPYFE